MSLTHTAACYLSPQLAYINISVLEALQLHLSGWRCGLRTRGVEGPAPAGLGPLLDHRCLNDCTEARGAPKGRARKLAEARVGVSLALKSYQTAGSRRRNRTEGSLEPQQASSIPAKPIASRFGFYLREGPGGDVTGAASRSLPDVPHLVFSSPSPREEKRGPDMGRNSPGSLLPQRTRPVKP